MPEVRLPLLHRGQRRLHDGLGRFNVARMGRRWGKTVFGLDYLLDGADGYTALTGGPVGWFAPNYKYLVEPWQEAKRMLHGLIRRKSEVLHRLDLVTGGSIEFWTLEDEDAGRSRKYSRVVIDEAAMVRGLLDRWQKSIRPTLTDLSGHALFCSTPNGRNDFWELDQRSLTRPNWRSFQAPTWDNPYIDPSEIEDAKRDLPELVFRQEYGAEYVDFGGALIRSDWCQNGLPDYAYPIVMAVDLAISKREEADYTAIVLMSRDRAGRVFILHVERFRESFHRILERIKAVAAQWKPRIIGIEEVQFQAAVTQELVRTTALHVVGVKPDRDKRMRFGPLAARYEQGLVYHSPDLPAYWQDELLAFTGTDLDIHEDMIDAASLAFSLLPAAQQTIATALPRTM